MAELSNANENSWIIYMHTSTASLAVSFFKIRVWQQKQQIRCNRFPLLGKRRQWRLQNQKLEFQIQLRKRQPCLQSLHRSEGSMHNPSTLLRHWSAVTFLIKNGPCMCDMTGNTLVLVLVCYDAFFPLQFSNRIPIMTWKWAFYYIMCWFDCSVCVKSDVIICFPVTGCDWPFLLLLFFVCVFLIIFLYL